MGIQLQLILGTLGLVGCFLLRRLCIRRGIWDNNLVYAGWGVLVIGSAVWLISTSIEFLKKPEFLTATMLLLLLVLLVVAAAIVAGVGQQADGSLIRNVPANQAWVLRNAWYSGWRNIPNSEDQQPFGYTAKREGWRFYIPYLWHIDLGVVDLSPQPRDPDPITVNTRDNQTATIDWRIVTVVSEPIRFVVKTNGNRKEFEDQRATVVFNQLASQKTQAELTSFTTSELERWGWEARNLFNQRIAYLGIQAVALEIKKILMPEEIRAAAEYETVSKKRKEVAVVKGQELKTIIESTGADPTVVTTAEMIRGALADVADIILKLRTDKEEKK